MDNVHARNLKDILPFIILILRGDVVDGLCTSSCFLVLFLADTTQKSAPYVLDLALFYCPAKR